MKNQQLVSVIIITHNRSLLLQNAVKSVLAQSYKNIEILIVDDFSSDDTEKVMREMMKKHDNIKYIKLNKQSGANVARNTGIKQASGFYITGLDDDDIMLPTRVEKMVNKYSNKYAYVFTEVYYVSKQKVQLKKFSYFKDEITLSDMLYKNCTGNQVLTTRDRFIKAGLYDESLVAAQDYDMWLRLLLLKPKAILIKEPLMNIDRDDSVMRISSSKKKIIGYFHVYKKYKQYMNVSQKKFQLYKIFIQKGKKINKNKFFLFFSPQYIILYIYLNLKLLIKNV